MNRMETQTDLQKKAAEFAKRYEGLPMQEKIGIIAQTFGCKSGQIESSPCSGKWQGTSDLSLRFDNGASLFFANVRTANAGDKAMQKACIDILLARYNPETVAAAKETALAALKKQEVRDNAIAAQKGLKPYTVLNVELNDGAEPRGAGYIGWYYVTLAVDGKIRAHLESGLAHEIANGTVGELPALERYYAAGGLKEDNVDYVFNNVGFSAASTLYSLPLGRDVLERAEKALAVRGVPMEHAQPRKPSIRAQLAQKPVPGGKPAAKSKDREVR